MFNKFKKSTPTYNLGDCFHCGNHNFSTNDFIEWQKHNQEESHTVNGSAPCNYCGTITQYSYTGKIERPMPPSLCNECRQKIENTIQSM